ncbi:phage tail-like protein [Tumebacillus sp. BK434]|uniref:Phage tail protein n=1 Tax=Tumebacillus avium TaxID=1903704 RepID=A0A1Y0IRG5_9BACL|nr:MULTISPECIES: phage tail protein [Tumebacillus]ARU62619.1 phage tail protein [Tumebacillus avium]TCP58999.1 phage tail-like protein [Tumebacillus sp. BK434]
MSDRKDPYRKFRFKVEYDGIVSAGFSEVSGYDASVDVVEYREGTEVTTPRKLPGLTKYGNITLKRGMTDNMELFNWIFQYIEKGEIVRKSITITVMDEKGADAAAFQIINAWPMKYTGPDLNATASEVTIESLEIAHEGMKRTK